MSVERREEHSISNCIAFLTLGIIHLMSVDRTDSESSDEILLLKITYFSSPGYPRYPK
jgi:hypothetical protein